MIRAVIDCDGCRRRDAAEAQLLYVTLPEPEDGAGGHPPSRLQRVDLCPKCLAAALARFVNRLPVHERRDWVRQYGVGETPG
jgi:hypothetical protein